MNGAIRGAQRILQTCVKNVTKSSALLNHSPISVKRDFTRGIWHMSCSKRISELGACNIHKNSNLCSCGCGFKGLHTKGERELVEFLAEEIVAERKAQKVQVLPKEVDGFVVKTDGAEVVLTKQLQDETVNITFNVNHSVDSEDDFNENELEQEKQEFAEMRSKPQFEVDIVKGDSTLGFTCSFLQEQSLNDADEYSDLFGIDEVSFCKGEWNNKVYAVAGDVLDGYLYDLLMNLLEEKGISNNFVMKLSDFSTAYEHSAYINFLENVSKFTSGKQ